MRLVERFLPAFFGFLIITVFYFVFRLPNLTYQPIFADEAIYIRWAQVMKNEPTLRFLPLSDGKTPLYMWTMMPLFKIFDDPLFAGRILSVFTGYVTLLGVFALGWVFFSLRVGLWGAFLIAVTPFIVFFDRLALVDTMLSAFTIWSIFFSLLLIRYPRIDLAMILGYFIGGSMLSKTPGFFNMVTLPVSIITAKFTKSTREKSFLRIFGLWIITVLVTLMIYNVLRLGPGFSNLNSRNQDYVFSPLQLINRPLDPFIPHLRDVFDWTLRLIGWVGAVLILVGVGHGIFKKNKYVIAVILISFIPMVIEMAFLKTFTARYLLFMVPSFLLIAAYGLDSLILSAKKFYQGNVWKKYFTYSLALVALLIWPVYFNGLLAFDIEKAPIPLNERKGYLEEWTAGTGLKEIAEYLDSESRNGLIIVGTEGTFGTLPDGLQIYLDSNRNVAIIGGEGKITDKIRKASFKQPTYFVANKSRYSYYQEGVELIKEIHKAKGDNGTQDAMLLFRVLPIIISSESAKVAK